MLLLAAILSAPWHGVAGAAIVWGLLGLSGIVYEIIVARRMRVQILYTPEFEDWLFHVLLPFAAYATLAGSAYAARSNVGGALFGVGAAALLLLFIGLAARSCGKRQMLWCIMVQNGVNCRNGKARSVNSAKHIPSPSRRQKRACRG